MERETAGYRRLHVGPQSQRSPRHFGYDGKTTVELDRIEHLAIAAGQVEHGFKHGVLCMAFVKLVADQIIARLFG